MTARVMLGFLPWTFLLEVDMLEPDGRTIQAGEGSILEHLRLPLHETALLPVDVFYITSSKVVGGRPTIA